MSIRRSIPNNRLAAKDNKRTEETHDEKEKEETDKLYALCVGRSVGFATALFLLGVPGVQSELLYMGLSVLAGGLAGSAVRLLFPYWRSMFLLGTLCFAGYSFVRAVDQFCKSW